MAALHRVGMLVFCIVLIAPVLAGQDLARYRNFELGTSGAAILKETRSEPSNLKTLYTTPERIQTLQWNRQDYFPLPSVDAKDPVRAIRFDFYDDRLFRIVARYDNRLLEGMTAADLIEAISETYGPSSTSEETVVVSSYATYIDEQKVLASWTNGENTFSLFRSSLGGEFGLVASSDRLKLLAAESVREARRLETAAAPQREIDRLEKEAETRRLAEEKARSLNKPNFRP
jgi:hypothetical protein